jgi:uncharacterized membrane protein
VAQIEEASELAMAIDAGYFTNVVMTVLTVLTFFVLVLVFLYMVWGREEAASTRTKTKAKPTQPSL